MRAARDPDEARTESHGVVPSDDPTIAAAHGELDVARGATPDGLRRRRGAREAAIEVDQEVGPVGVGRGTRRDGPQAEFAHQPILQRAPQALDAALGLGRARLHVSRCSPRRSPPWRSRRARCIGLGI